MTKNKLALASISMDLERVAMGYQRGSIAMANRFLEEAMKRRDEIDRNSVKPYIRKLLLRLNTMIREKDQQKIAEDALMYSILFQNSALARQK